MLIDVNVFHEKVISIAIKGYNKNVYILIYIYTDTLSRGKSFTKD
jgi:hypothetical protein